MANAEREPMRVIDLITKLESLDPDAYVYADGCDCVGPALDAFYDGDHVLISREIQVRDPADPEPVFDPVEARESLHALPSFRLHDSVVFETPRDA